MRSSGVSALLPPLVGDDWKKMGDEEGATPSPIRRLEARGVAWKVGLLGGSCRDDELGDAVEFLEERPLRLCVGDDMVDMN
jgi:hypothetical protein